MACEILTKGFYVPDVLCVISARPYRKSLSSHIQQLGRVMRPSPGKEFALWLDHAGNLMRFWSDQQHLFAHGVADLKDGALDKKQRKEPDEKDEGRLCCVKCGFVLAPSIKICPSCGHERKSRSLVEAEAGVMVSIDGTNVAAAGKHEFLADPKQVWQQLAYLGLERKNGDPDAAQKFAQAQYRTIYGKFSRATIGNTEIQAPSDALRGLVQHNIIRWARRRVAA